MRKLLAAKAAAGKKKGGKGGKSAAALAAAKEKAALKKKKGKKVRMLSSTRLHTQIHTQSPSIEREGVRPKTAGISPCVKTQTSEPKQLANAALIFCAQDKSKFNQAPKAS